MNEFLVELSEPRSIRKIDGVKTAVGNCPAGYDGGHSRCTVAGYAIGHPVPRDSCFELARNIRRILS